jgi:hypothetical protein
MTTRTMPASTTPQPRWRIEIRASTYPLVVWEPLTRPSGALYKFVERYEADEALAKLKAVQPHAVFRLAPI